MKNTDKHCFPHFAAVFAFGVYTGAGALFEALCPGVALDPQIKYNGTYKRGKLEKVFEAAAKNTLKTMGDEGQMVSLDRLQVMRGHILLLLACSTWVAFFFAAGGVPQWMPVYQGRLYPTYFAAAPDELAFSSFLVSSIMCLAENVFLGVGLACRGALTLPSLHD